jgi:hypothetical protein
MSHANSTLSGQIFFKLYAVIRDGGLMVDNDQSRDTDTVGHKTQNEDKEIKYTAQKTRKMKKKCIHLSFFLNFESVVNVL